MHPKENRPVIEPVYKTGLIKLLNSLEPPDEGFLDFDAGLLPAHDIDL